MQAIDPRSIGHKSDFAFEEIHLCLADVLQAYELLRHFKAEERSLAFIQKHQHQSRRQMRTSVVFV